MAKEKPLALVLGAGVVSIKKDEPHSHSSKTGAFVDLWLGCGLCSVDTLSRSKLILSPWSFGGWGVLFLGS